MTDAEQIIDEIHQIISQYKKEVPQKGRAWPSSIRERVIALSRLEISNGEIAKKTGIPVPTIYIWTSGKAFKRGPKSRQKSEFLSVQVIQKKQSEDQNKSFLTASEHSENLVARHPFYSVTLPGGIKVDQLHMDALVELSRRLSS